MWQPIDTYEKTGTMVLLLVEQEEAERSSNPTEDALIYRTIGFNNADHDGNDEWKIAGWNWENDYFTEGRGTPIGWQALPPSGENPS